MDGIMTTTMTLVTWSVVDVIFNTVTSFEYHLALETNMTSSAIVDTDVISTTLDLWVLSVIRAFLITLVALMFCCVKHYVIGLVTYYAALLTLLLTWIYNGAKVLLFSEHDQLLYDWCRQAQLGWTCGACVVSFVLLLWVRHRYRKRHLGTSEEKEALLGGGKNKGEDSAKEAWGTSTLCQFVKISLPELPALLCGLGFLFGTIACELLAPFYIGQVIDGLMMEQSQQAFRAAIFRLAGVSGCLALCTWARIWIIGMYVARVTARLRQRFFASVMSQDLDFFYEHETGDLVAQLLSGVATMGDSLSANLDQGMRGLFCGVGVLVFMVRTSWQLSLLSVMCLPAFAAVCFFYGTAMKHIGSSSQWIMARMGDHAEESFSNIRTVRSFAMETKHVETFRCAVTRLYGNGKKEALVHSTLQSLIMFIEGALKVCVVLYGGHLVQRHILTGGGLVTFVMYLNIINYCVQLISWVYSMLAKGLGASQVVFQHIGRKPKFNGKGSVVKSSFRGEIEFKNVYFSYPSRPHQLVLSNLSFRVRPGEKVALVGTSGSGKSTCVSLLQNFYQPTSGQVLLDGVPVHRYDHHCLHRKMALVGQEPALFSCTIRDNITYGLDECSEADVISAARQANAHDFICAMRNGYDTLAGEKGLLVSGGQKQRLAIARALVRQPAVLLLDESTSALDSQSEAKVQESINNSTMGRTVLIIAHRLSTVKKADRVLVIHKGHVVEDGTPSDLLNLGGLFTSLAQHQFARTGSSLSSSCDSLSLGAETFEEDEGGEDGSFANDKLCSGSLDSGLDFSFRPTTASQC